MSAASSRPMVGRCMRRLLLACWYSSAWLASAFLAQPPPSSSSSPKQCPSTTALASELYNDLYSRLPRDGHPYLDKSLRLELLKYGELTQLTYDSFESRELNQRTGRTYWGAQRFFDRVKDWVSEDTSKYRIKAKNETAWEDNFLYANVAIFDPKGDISWLDFIPPVRWIKKQPPVRAVLDKACEIYRSISPPPNVTQIEQDLNRGLTIPRETGSAWIGYIAVDEEAGDVVVAFRGTILPDEWKANILGNILQTPEVPLLMNNGENGNTLTADNPKLQELVDSDSNLTALLKQWKDNLQRIRVHEGFKQLFNTPTPRNSNKDNPLSPRQKMQDRLMQLVNEEMPGRVKTITFVGHSLGGALATLAAGYMALKRDIEKLDAANWKDITIRAYTFSAPRVGGPMFRKELLDRRVAVLNTINAWDVVPTVPGIVNAIFDSVIRTIWRREPVTGESFGLPNWSAFLEKVPVVGPFILQKLVVWNYVNSGLQLAFDSGKKDPAMRTLGANPLTWLEIGPKHNLEGLLYMIANQYNDTVHSPQVFRDVALMNKSDRLLKKEVMRALDIPANWWQPQESKGIRPHPVASHNGRKEVIFRDVSTDQ